MFGPYKSRNVCSECARRKIKCDRLIPCRNCVKKNLESKCVELDSSKSGELDDFKLCSFYLEYEHSVVDIGVFKTQLDVLPTRSACLDRIDVEVGYKLLDFSVTNIGCLYFGFIHDITELYDLLPKVLVPADVALNESYDKVLIWAIFQLSIYYMDTKALNEILGGDDPLDVTAHNKLINGVSSFIIEQLNKLNFLANPNVRLLQIVAILSNTTFPFTNVALSNNLLVLSLNLLKYYKQTLSSTHFNEGSSKNVLLLKLIKATTKNIWYRFAIQDYLQSNSFIQISIHNHIPSLLNDATINSENDPYQDDETFDLLYWKIISLDRDIEQYTIESRRPVLKTLDTIKKNINTVNETIIKFIQKNEQDKQLSINSKFEKFILKFLINAISWKLYRMYFINYNNVDDAFSKMSHHCSLLISQIVKNIKSKREFFNKIPVVIIFLSRIVTFYTYFQLVTLMANINDNKQQILDLSIDLNELMLSLPSTLNPVLKKLLTLLERFNKLITLWDKIKIIDNINILKHPILLILQNDINYIHTVNNKIPNLINSNILETLNQNLFNDYGYKNDYSFDHHSESFKLIINEFESKYNIKDIIGYIS